MKNLKHWLVLLLTLVGNFSFVSLVYAAAHPAGTNVLDNGTIYMITDDLYRRPYTSAGAFLSYGFNSWSKVVQASKEDLALPKGSFIPPRDGKIVCSDRGEDKGTCYLITNGKRAAFVSEAVFKELGFSFAKALTGDVSFLEKDSDISGASEQHRSGVLINKNGTIYLVSSSGLMGIPSLDVLKSWGYTFGDAVTANVSDNLYSSGAIIQTRSGAKLSPSSVGNSGLNEDSLIQSYIDTYPDFPSTTVSAPQDGALVIELVKKIQGISNGSVENLKPYLGSKTIELLNSSGKFKSFFESSGYAFLPYLQPWNSNIQVFEGGRALYTEIKKQDYTGYIRNIYWAAIKENGVWKWDFLGEMKQYDVKSKQENPSQTFVTGSGASDITVIDAAFTTNAYVNDPNTFLVAEVKNLGLATVRKFVLTVKLNNSVIIEEVKNFDIESGKSLLLAIPLDRYWKIATVNKAPGQYSADIMVSLDSTTSESNSVNNSTVVSGYLQQKPAAVN